MKLFCFPCAGGSATMYFKWKKYFPEIIEILPVELTGRGSRANEPYYDTFNELIIDLTEFVKNKLFPGEKYALLGFSMGGIIVYEVYKSLERENVSLPKDLFIIAKESPDTAVKKICHLPDDLFLKEIISYDGIPEVVLNNDDLLRFYLPTLRADFKLIEDYNFDDNTENIKCDITVLWGENDRSVVKNGIYNWEKYTSFSFYNYSFSGGHFFMNDHVEDIANILINKLLS